MNVTAADIQKKYSGMPDYELAVLNPETLTDEARFIYKEELSKRALPDGTVASIRGDIIAEKEAQKKSVRSQYLFELKTFFLYVLTMILGSAAAAAAKTIWPSSAAHLIVGFVVAIVGITMIKRRKR